MKPNVIFALLVGLVVGFAVGKVVSGSSDSASSPVAAAGSTDESSLTVKSTQMPSGILNGLTPAQTFAAMKAMNTVGCPSCPGDTVAGCLKGHTTCEGGLNLLRKAADLARQGQTAEQIIASMGGAPAARPAPANDSVAVKVPLDEKNPIKGKNTALVTIVEFSDYQCPFCGRAEGTMKQIADTYGDKVRFVMKQNPLGFHDRARPAALAALAAGEQGKYWEMHDKLFANMQALDDASLERYAKEIGLNVDKWKAALKDSKLAEVITRDQALAGQLGATGTPAFFINGRKISGAQPFENFKQVIDQEITKAEALVNSGVKPEQVYAKVMEQAGSAPAPAPAPAAPPAETAKVEIPAEAPFKGPKHAKVTIVEWSEFQCPFCARVLPTLKQVEDAYGKDVKIVFRHQPLPFHNNAQIAAEASMAAHEQGKFWPMHDKMFANQQSLDRPSLERFAQELGLDMNKFKAALDSGKYKAYVQADSAAGNAVGANGTPTFFINGRKHVGAQPFESFKAIIDQELEKANKLLASGTKIENLYKKLQDELAAAPTPAAAPAAPAKVDIAVGNAPVKGPKNAPVTIVAYSDFECPFCSRVVPTLKQLEDQYKGKIKVAFKHQPLPFHSNARLAAAASMAANEQGKFWEMHDKLFENQRALDRGSLEKYALELGLDMNKFKAALDSNKFDAHITADSQEGNRVGANGTPTFFINGRQLVGAQPIDAFKAIIEDELKKGGK